MRLRRAAIQKADCRRHRGRRRDAPCKVCRPIRLLDCSHFEEPRWCVLRQPQFCHRVRMPDQPFHCRKIGEGQNDVALWEADRVRLRGHVQTNSYGLKCGQSTITQPYLPPRRLSRSREQVRVIGKERSRRCQLHVVDSRDQCFVFWSARFGVFVTVGLDPFVKEICGPLGNKHGGRYRVVAFRGRLHRYQLD
jgi:hypothetical protein